MAKYNIQKQTLYWFMLVSFCVWIANTIVFFANDLARIYDDLPIQKMHIEQKEQSISMLFLGDMMLDRTIRTKAESRGYEHLFECMKDLFSEYDYVVVNSEGTITDNQSVSQSATPLSPPSFRFTFDPEGVRVANESGIDIFGIANNHIYDYLREGVEETERKLVELGIEYFGSPINEDKRYINIEDRISIVSFNEFYGSKEETIEDIYKNKGSFVVVFAHWGDEYIEPSDRVKSWSMEFIDAGADLIVGHHPHVIQDSDEYKGKKIYYSLGNYIFDQYWEDAVRTGMALGVTFDEKETIFKEYLLNIQRDGQTCPAV